MKIGIATKNMQHKELAAERCDNAADRISELPDDILISIISLLPMQEATATRILSTRWRRLGASYATRLNFPPFNPKTGPLDEYLQKIEEKRFASYINMINHTLGSYKGGRALKEFRLHMPCLKGANIKRWVEFALAREVEIIDIQMHYLSNAITRWHYTLGLANLIRKKSLPGLKCLKELSLSTVHVNDTEVELLLSNFPLLESLSIAHSKRLKNVRVVDGHSLLKLKHLDISYAINVESIEICHMINLTSLRCYELPSTYVLRLNNVPKLIEFKTSDQDYNTLAEILSRIPSCIHDQLLLLNLSTYTPRTTISTIPDLINIKLLELEVLILANNHTDQLFSLIEACRTLEKLKIKFLWHPFWANFRERKISEHPPTKDLSPNLRELELSGYLGSPFELEFACFIVKNAVALEEVVVEPCEETPSIRRIATARAWQHFRPMTPNSVKLAII